MKVKSATHNLGVTWWFNSLTLNCQVLALGWSIVSFVFELQILCFSYSNPMFLLSVLLLDHPRLRDSFSAASYEFELPWVYLVFICFRWFDSALCRAAGTIYAVWYAAFEIPFPYLLTWCFDSNFIFEFWRSRFSDSVVAVSVFRFLPVLRHVNVLLPFA